MSVEIERLGQGHDDAVANALGITWKTGVLTDDREFVAADVTQ
jgi:hypothetical protein